MKMTTASSILVKPFDLLTRRIMDTPLSKDGTHAQSSATWLVPSLFRLGLLHRQLDTDDVDAMFTPFLCCLSLVAAVDDQDFVPAFMDRRRFEAIVECTMLRHVMRVDAG